MENSPIITIREGKLRGKISTDYYGGKYFSFQGIPYAKPPVGELRFKAPQLPEPWSGIRDATKEGNTSYSRHKFKGWAGSEDCLFLNVYTPELPSSSSSLKPVMFWIHGGTFLSGSGNTDFYGPEFLITQHVIIVTINYRLGLFGFLSMDDPDLGVPGNAGLKDQVMALKWVQSNIEHFCGDPNNVTAFGQSSGGASVHYLMLSPMSKGLFHKAIIQSGTAFDSWTRGQRTVPLIAKALNLETTDEKIILQMLHSMSSEEILKIQEKLPDDPNQWNIRAIGAVVENQNESAFLTEEPIELIHSNRFKKVPILIGYTSREGIFAGIQASTSGKIALVRDFERAIPYILNIQKGSKISLKVAQKIKQFYYGDEKRSLKNIEQYYLLETDSLFLYTIHNTVIKHHTAASSTPIYFYRMSVNSTLNVYKKIGKVRHSGVCHSDDIGYLFKTVLTPKIRRGSVEDEAVRRCVKLWATFARNGNPNPIEKDPLINVKWKPVEDGILNYLDIGENLTVGVNPDARRMEFWNQISSFSSPTSKL